METLLGLTNLSQLEFWICLIVIFLAGMVRGFSGFALSALVMAALVVILPPIELIVVCWFLEMSASLLMVRDGVRQWDRAVVTGLVVGSGLGLPVGLYLTNTLPIETSKAIALGVILTLAALQLLKVRAAFLATRPGVYLSGLTAGMATGLASVGGMVVALYVLARDAPANVMRASLVMYLFCASLVSFLFMNFYGMFDGQAIARGLLFAPICMAGVIAGQKLFQPRLEPYYKPFCLCLLMLLAAAGLARMGLA
ncbi:MAG: sulfite exporter TauE/SafE family protein [Rhizobiaceae bacterium]|nr:sulfite exporter TauE/SafE family protein [Hyphomicrobiales bacterium]NRB30984.1 sulfite exporter TauE/SafE family protein [Rhizobiaceae bacterium]